MKKKFFTLLVAFVLIFTTVLPALATDGTEADGSGERTVGTGGLDFYSITIHYDKPTLVSYIAKRSKYYFLYALHSRRRRLSQLQRPHARGRQSDQCFA